MVVYPTALSISYPYGEYIGVVLAFASFRLFDIWKPSTIGVIDRRVEGGLGVMGDDILAGFAGGFLSVVVMLVVDRVLL